MYNTKLTHTRAHIHIYIYIWLVLSVGVVIRDDLGLCRDIVERGDGNILNSLIVGRLDYSYN